MLESLLERRRQAQGRKSKSVRRLICPAAERRTKAKTGPGQQAPVAMPQKYYVFSGSPIIREVRRDSKLSGRVWARHAHEKRGGFAREDPSSLAERNLSALRCFCRIVKYAFAALLRRERKGKNILYGISFSPTNAFIRGEPRTSPENARMLCIRWYTFSAEMTRATTGRSLTGSPKGEPPG